MLFLCARCKTRYKVADEKVQGRVLKIRCRQCSALIVLRGNQQSSANESAGERVARPVRDRIVNQISSKPAAEQSTEIKWHVAIGREKKGPMTAAEVVALIRDGSLNGRSYIWRRGFESWQHLEAVGDFNAALESPVIPALDSPAIPNLPPDNNDVGGATVAMPGPSFWTNT